MESLPDEILLQIMIFCDCKDYVNFILSYDRILNFYQDLSIRKRYKFQFLRRICFPGYKYTIRADNHLKHGKWLRYYESGELYINMKYKNGLTQGEFTMYHKDGTVIYSPKIIKN